MPSDKARVLIGAPVHQRAWILPHYLDRLRGLDYPRGLISWAFVVNDSTDGSLEVLLDFFDRHGAEYRRVDIVTRNFGYPEDVRSNRHRDRIYYRLIQTRNHLLERLSDEDYLLSVDTDILVEPHMLKAFLANQKDICSALVYNDPNHKFPNVMKMGRRGQIVHYRDFPQNTLFRAAVTGAVYLMTADVAREIRYGYHRQGEDVAFCLNASSRGFGIWCDSRLQPRHVMYREQL